MGTFITNSRIKRLEKRLEELISQSKEIKILVGFFYFSGIERLVESLKSNQNVNLKILVGLNVDETIYGLFEHSYNTNLSNLEIKNKYFDSLVTSLNTEEFDNQNVSEHIQFFIQLLQEGRLEIRKTFEPNHSKLYLFKLADPLIVSHLFITGSSNLTKGGLSQNEFNVEIKDYGFEEAEQYFDDLWRDSLSIDRKDIIETIVSRTQFNDRFTPFEAFVLVLKQFIETEKSKLNPSLIDLMKENGYNPYRYQLDAIQQSLSILEKHNGVIIADVVGLGKTVIASAVAKMLNQRGIVICPPGLVGDHQKNSGWKKYLEEFKLYDWEVWSLGKLNDALEFVQKRDDIEVVIVDEAHRFRNQDSKGYEILKNICRRKKVILLTATPFNNKPEDIFALLKLFITPRRSSITIEENLEYRFHQYKKEFDMLAYIYKYHNSPSNDKKTKAKEYYYKFFSEEAIDIGKVKSYSRKLAQKIRDILEPVTIRRNRLDLQKNPAYKEEIKDLPEVKDPQEWFYELTERQSEFYDKVLSYFNDSASGGKFNGAIYKPFEYYIQIENESKLDEVQNFELESQRNLFDFMRRLLVKRFESSFGSFKKSLENFITRSEKILNFINNKQIYIYDRSLIEKMYNWDEDQILEYLNQNEENHNLVYYKIDEFERKDEFLRDIKSDVELFQNILKELEDLNFINEDPKVECLIKNVKKILKHKENGITRKVVIFTEYKDTLEYLAPLLNSEFNGRVLAISDLTASKIEAIHKNFNASFQLQEDKYDILMGTDRISEGFNLNRAGVVINYDIPWNPVRVIQRLGRINRIGKKLFNELYIVNFFPSEKGSDIVRSREIAMNKMFLIHNVLGEDTKIFDPEEEPTPSRLYNRIQTNPELLEEESLYTKVINLYEEIKHRYPEIVQKLEKESIPSRIKLARKGKEDELLVFYKKDRLYVYVYPYNASEILQPPFEEVLEKIQCDYNEIRLPLSEKFWKYYSEIKKEVEQERNIPERETSIKNKALNNIRYLLKNQSLQEFKKFLFMLKEDIEQYGTLPEYTLRRIAELDFTKSNFRNELQTLMKNLGGEDYLEKEKQKLKNIKKEIIIAIENQKGEVYE